MTQSTMTTHLCATDACRSVADNEINGKRVCDYHSAIYDPPFGMSDGAAREAARVRAESRKRNNLGG